MKIEVIIPNYNGLSLLKKNLPKVLKVMSNYKNSSITVVDDGSEDGSYIFLEELANKHSNIKIIRHHKNQGFSSSINTAAFSSKAELIVLLNTDAVPHDKFLDLIIKDFSHDENLFAVGCMDESIEDGIVVLRGRGVGKWEKGFLLHERGEVDRDNTLWVSGGSSVIKRSLFIKLGGFDTLYSPFYWEDIDLSYRAQKAGYRIKFEKNSVVEHKHGEGAIKTHYNNLEITTIAYRNQFIFVWKNITDGKLLLSNLLWIPHHLFISLITLNLSLLLGFLFAIYKIPVIIQKRFSQERLYKLSDIDILAQFSNK